MTMRSNLRSRPKSTEERKALRRRRHMVLRSRRANRRH